MLHYNMSLILRYAIAQELKSTAAVETSEDS